MRKHLIRMYNETCKDEACGLHEAMSHFVSAYREMKQVRERHCVILSRGSCFPQQKFSATAPFSPRLLHRRKRTL